MRKVIFLLAFFLTALVYATPTLADSSDLTKVETFIQSVIQVMLTLGGLIAAGFIAWGGFGYVTSTGSPENLEKSKKTILYSGLGLVVILGAFVISNIVTQLATGAFGK